MDLKPGDVVILKSGGHPLSVVEVNDGKVACVWMGNEGDLFRETLPLAVLELAEPDTDDEEEDDEEDDEDEEEEESTTKEHARQFRASPGIHSPATSFLRMDPCEDLIFAADRPRLSGRQRWKRNGRETMTHLPRAMLIDMDDTILSAYGRPEIAWHNVAAEFAAEFGPFTQHGCHCSSGFRAQSLGGRRRRMAAEDG